MHSFVITGFLGVGKTTMLTQTVTRYFGDKKIAIVVNEFGDVGIDSKILTNVHSEVLEISEGCICCKLAEEFESGVTEILRKYDPDILFVETSGASEPFPIFLSLQNLGIPVEGIICVCDAKNFDSYSDNATAKYQLGGSNIIVLNKTDLVDDVELARVTDAVTAVKEQYNIKNNLTGETIFDRYMIHHADHGLVGREAFEGVYAIEEIAGMARDYSRPDHTVRDAITQKAAYLKADIAFSDIDELLSSLPKNIYRVKGVVKTQDVPAPLLVNYAFGNVSFQELPEYDADSILIFIGDSIENEVAALCERFPFLLLPRFRAVR